MERKVVHKWQKNSSEWVCCGVDTVKGHDLFFAGVFYREGPLPTSELKPTRKTLAIRIDQISELESAVKKAKREIQRQLEREATVTLEKTGSD